MIPTVNTAINQIFSLLSIRNDFISGNGVTKTMRSVNKFCRKDCVR